MSVAYKLEDYFTYADYCKWDGSERWELIDGIPYAMAAPRPVHQEVVGNLFLKFREHLDGKKCKVFVSATDVRLNHNKADDTVVQPDIFVVRNPDIIGESAINGVPDLVIEVLSPSTAKYDKTTKLNAYRKVGVGELWYVDPDIQLIEVLTLVNGEYTVQAYAAGCKLAVGTLPGLEIDLESIFGIEAIES